MNTILWVLQILLAIALGGAGAAKLAQPKAKLASTPNMGWANDFSPQAIRLIGVAEVLGGLGLVLPAALRILPWLTPLAALGLAALMLGAVMVHLRRRESFVVPLMLAVLAVLICIGRFWLVPIV